MALTANTGFRFFRSLTGGEALPIPVPVRIANSVTLRSGDAVRVNAAGFLVTAGASGVPCGVIGGFTDQNGINPLSLGYNTGNPGVTLTGDDTITTSSSNQTSASFIQAEVIMDPAGNVLWLNKADGTLAQSNLLQMYTLDANARQVATASASDTTGTFQLIALDPEATGGATADTTKGLFRLAGNQFGMLLDIGTAKVAA